jgi:hypothetical protein
MTTIPEHVQERTDLLKSCVFVAKPGSLQRCDNDTGLSCPVCGDINRLLAGHLIYFNQMYDAEIEKQKIGFREALEQKQAEAEEVNVAQSLRRELKMVKTDQERTVGNNFSAQIRLALTLKHAVDGQMH